MNKDHILLSVSMLISGRDEMEKSLNSLLFFKNAFPTEIILVDTGCNALQRALAEKYADKIIDFTWCKDFAAARNAGLRETQGEWFMYLDDDEWFENPTEIISFFLSGEYKKYKSASYEVRNYLDAEGKSYKTSYPSRMVKKEKDTCFIGKIHEYITPFELPQKKFTDYVHHYGYAYKNNTERAQHAARNIEPLIEMRKECPGEPRWMFQLAQEYLVVQNYEKAIEVCEQGLEEWEKYKMKIKFSPIHIGVLYAYILLSYECINDTQKEVEWLDKALKNPLMNMPVMEMCRAYYYMMGARVYNTIGKSELCIDYLRKYVTEFERLHNDRNALETEAAGAVTSVFRDETFTETIMMCLKTVIRHGKYEYASELFDMVTLKDIESVFQEDWAEKLIDAVCCKEYKKLFEKIVQMLFSGEKITHNMLHVFMRLMGDYKQQEACEKENNLHRLIACIGSDHFYILSQKIIWENIKSCEAGITDKLFEKLFTVCADHILEIEDEVWKIADKGQINVEDLLLQIDYRTWRRELAGMEQWGICEEWEKWNDRIQSWKSREDIRYDFFDIKYKESNLAKITKKTESLSELEEQLWKYADIVYEFYQPYYREDVLVENSIGLPDELQLALELRNLRGYRKTGPERYALETMKKCLGVYPKLDKTMLVYAEMLRDEMKKQTVEADEAKKELLQMASSLKEMAKKQIVQGNIDAARQILLQTQQYVPEDEEIRNILKKLENR